MLEDYFFQEHFLCHLQTPGDFAADRAGRVYDVDQTATPTPAGSWLVLVNTGGIELHSDHVAEVDITHFGAVRLGTEERVIVYG